MTVSRPRPTFGKTSAMSGGVYVALLTALLLLSPQTARVLAQVLAQNGVPLPAHVVRVLDALPTEPTRDISRRDDEAVAKVVAETIVSVEPAPETVAVRALQVVPVRASFAALPPALRFASRQVTPRPILPGRSSPRAPPA